MVKNKCPPKREIIHICKGNSKSKKCKEAKKCKK